MNPLKHFLLELQEVTGLLWRVLKGLRKRPRYFAEMIQQMDQVGVGSLGIVVLTGFFTGGVLILQAYPTLQYYGAQSNAGQGVATSLIRELGPVLTALMVAGRVGSSISAELGSMVVSQQIEAMRALGTSPARKLVTPRLVALLVCLPLLTIAADFFGLLGGGIVANQIYGLDTNVYISSVRTGTDINALITGVIKPIFFGLIIGLVSCHKGLTTKGGTVGVGVSTTQAVVISSICIIISDFFLSKVLQSLMGTTLF
ncbi:MAG: ABC transporter permease [Acidobacteria bacterium]|jgi:phospholipid/cholesterol/gamma-HCH transport system permease protein|nr:ABC transporter permease [Acidobacteriota bacterium]MBK9527345.1 ABC transporter permease [Acidobacteriota bacterium]MBP7473923.1 ABC transporter permease [Pyrinomonadaceae bacterium]MBP9109123.1 ABC transporter permease [Pyrinomonadaceae bacterium]